MSETQFPFMGRRKRRETPSLPAAPLRGCVTPDARGKHTFLSKIPWPVKGVPRGAEVSGIWTGSGEVLAGAVQEHRGVYQRALSIS